LNIDWTFIFGAVNNNPDQPVVLQRVFRAISEDGRPQTALRLVFLQPDRQRPEVFWFGAFVLSQGRRVILYFPYEVTGFDFVDRWPKHRRGGIPLDPTPPKVARRSWHLPGTDRSGTQVGHVRCHSQAAAAYGSELRVQDWSDFPSCSVGI